MLHTPTRFKFKSQVAKIVHRLKGLPLYMEVLLQKVARSVKDHSFAFLDANGECLLLRVSPQLIQAGLQTRSTPRDKDKVVCVKEMTDHFPLHKNRIRVGRVRVYICYVFDK